MLFGSFGEQCGSVAPATDGGETLGLVDLLGRSLWGRIRRDGLTTPEAEWHARVGIKLGQELQHFLTLVFITQLQGHHHMLAGRHELLQLPVILSQILGEASDNDWFCGNREAERAANRLASFGQSIGLERGHRIECIGTRVVRTMTQEHQQDVFGVCSPVVRHQGGGLSSDDPGILSVCLREFFEDL